MGNEEVVRTAGVGSREVFWLTEAGRWIVVTLLIPFAGLVWDRVQVHEANRAKVLETEKAAQLRVIEQLKLDEQRRSEQLRADSDLVVKLIPSLGEDPASPARAVALAVLSQLSASGVTSPPMVAAVQVALDESAQRLQDGVAGSTERKTLTRLAVAQDRVALAAESNTSDAAAAVGQTAIALRDVGFERTRAELQQLPKLSPAAQQAAAPALAVPRLYVQVYEEADRIAADKLRAWAADTMKWLAPGVQNVTATAAKRGTKVPAGSSEVRVVYFNDSDEKLADELVDWLGKQKQSVSKKRSTLHAPGGQVEVWYPKRAS